MCKGSIREKTNRPFSGLWWTPRGATWCRGKKYCTNTWKLSFKFASRSDVSCCFESRTQSLRVTLFPSKCCSSSQFILVNSKKKVWKSHISSFKMLPIYDNRQTVLQAPKSTFRLIGAENGNICIKCDVFQTWQAGLSEQWNNMTIIYYPCKRRMISSSAHRLNKWHVVSTICSHFSLLFSLYEFPANCF